MQSKGGVQVHPLLYGFTKQNARVECTCAYGYMILSCGLNVQGFAYSQLGIVAFLPFLLVSV